MSSPKILNSICDDQSTIVTSHANYDERQAVLPASLHFDQASVVIRTEVDCWDLAVTPDGRVLIAAGVSGLLTYSELGELLGVWRPRKVGGDEDEVLTVDTLSHCRAVVGLSRSKLVVQLWCSSPCEVWREEWNCTVALEAPPRRLSVCRDIAAVTEFRLSADQLWVQGNQLTLVILSSGQLLCRQTREYDIRGVAITATFVVTTSLEPVTYSDGESTYVVDAYSHAGSYLWRLRARDGEIVTGINAMAAWNLVCMYVMSRDGSSCRVMISDGNGKTQQDLMSTETHGLRRYGHLSLATDQQRTIMAVLNWVEEGHEANHATTVTIYHANQSDD